MPAVFSGLRASVVRSLSICSILQYFFETCGVVERRRRGEAPRAPQHRTRAQHGDRWRVLLLIWQVRDRITAHCAFHAARRVRSSSFDCARVKSRVSSPGDHQSSHFRLARACDLLAASSAARASRVPRLLQNTACARLGTGGRGHTGESHAAERQNIHTTWRCPRVRWDRGQLFRNPRSRDGETARISHCNQRVAT